MIHSLQGTLRVWCGKEGGRKQGLCVSTINVDLISFHLIPRPLDSGSCTVGFFCQACSLCLQGWEFPFLDRPSSSPICEALGSSLVCVVFVSVLIFHV